MRNKITAILLTAAMTVSLLTATAYADASAPAAAAADTQSSISAAASGYDTELTPVGTVFSADGVKYLVTSMTEAEVYSVDGSQNPADLVIPSTVSYESDTYTVTAAADGAFAGLGSVKTLTIPSTLTSIGSGSMLSSLQSITLASGNASLFLQNGVLFSKVSGGNELVLYPSGLDAVSYVIPNGTTSVRSNAFYGNKNLLTVIIPSSVRTIAKDAFVSFANPAAFAFDTDTAPSSVAGRAFELDAASNIFYFRNEGVLEAIQAEAANFAGDSDVSYETAGMPAYIQTIEDSASGTVLNSSSAEPVLQAAGDDAGIADGYYVIHSNVNSGYVLDISNGRGSAENFGNADIHSWSGDDMQIFKVTKVDAANNLYTFTNAMSGKVLDVAGRGTTDGTNVQQYDSNGTPAQQFRILQTGEDGVYTIVTSYSSMVLDVSGGIAENGRNVQVWTGNGTNAQKWTMTAVADPTADDLAAGIYTIHTSVGAANSSDLSTRTLDIKNGSTLSGANVQIYDANGSNAQKFLFIPLGNKYYYILNAFTRKALDVQGGSTENGANVQIYTENDTEAQIWRVKENADGTYTITNRKSGMSLDVSGGISENGRNVQVWESNYTPAQKWILGLSSISISGLYTIASAADRTKVLDMTSGSLDDGAKVQIYGSNETNAQKFMMSSAGSDLYILKNLKSGKVLDITGGQMYAGNTLQQYTSNETSAQKFQLVPTGDRDGSYYIQSFDGAYRIGISGSSPSVHAAIVLTSPDNSQPTQKWYLQGTAYTDGWQVIYGVPCYIVNGNIVKNTWVGNIYVDGNGAIYQGWHAAPSDSGVYKQGYYYYFDGTNGAQSDARPYIGQLYPTKASTIYYNIGDGRGYRTENGYDCHYTIYVDRANCLVTVYTSYPGTSAANVPIWEFKTSPGISGTSRETDAGHTTIYYKNNWFELMGPTYGQYVTLINTAGEYFHSIPGQEANDHCVDAGTYNLLGTQQSHGCCRLCVRCAYWIYAFCWNGTDIYVGDNYVHPIETYYQPKMQNGQWIDPTDVHYTGNYGYADNGVYYGYHGTF